MSYYVVFDKSFQHITYTACESYGRFCLSCSGFLTLGSGLIMAEFHEFGVDLDLIERLNNSAKTGAS
jgi:hypothetical protein